MLDQRIRRSKLDPALDFGFDPGVNLKIRQEGFDLNRALELGEQTQNKIGGGPPRHYDESKEEKRLAGPEYRYLGGIPLLGWEYFQRKSLAFF